MDVLYYIMMVPVWFLGLLMAYGAVVLVLSLFWKGEVGREMRKGCLVWILVIFGPFIIILTGNLIYNSCNSKDNDSIKKGFLSTGDNPDSVVFICTGGTAKKYHKYSDCRWLNSCGGEIEGIFIDEARHKGRTPCKSCYK